MTQETEPPSLPQDADDDTLIEVPIGYLRNALWYYDNYFVEKELRETYQEKYGVLNESIVEYQEELAESRGKYNTLKTVVITLGALFVIETAADITVHAIR